MKTRNRGFSTRETILILLVFLQFLSICFINFTKSYSFLDYDSSLALRHAIEMWKNGIFLKDFTYFSTLEIDCASFFAAPIYLLTNNLNLSYGIIHITIYLIITYIVYDITHNAEMESEAFYTALLVIFSPYAWGQLDWSNMIFISAGQYSFKIIVMLLLLDIMLLCEAKPATSSKKFYLTNMLYYIFLFWTSLSSGNYVLLMIVFPFTLKVAFDIINQQKFSVKDKRVAAILISCCICFISLGIRNHYVGSSSRSDLLLISADRFFTNIQNCIAGIVLLFGGLTTPHSYSILSSDGVMCMIRFAFLLVCIALTTFYFIKKEVKHTIKYYCISYIFINLSVLLVTDSTYGAPVFEYRYHIPWSILLLLLTASIGAKYLYTNTANTWAKNLTIVSAFLGLIFINIYGFHEMYTDNEHPNYEESIINIAKTNNIDTVYLYNRYRSSHIIRALDLSLNCVSVSLEGNPTVDTGDFYDSYADVSKADQSHILVCNANEFEDLPQYMKNSYQFGSVLENEDHLYYSAYNYWDGRSGLPSQSQSTSIDYPFSYGYNYSGAISEDGTLITDGGEGYVLYGPYTETMEGAYDITLHYNFIEGNGEKPAFFDVSIDHGSTQLGYKNLEMKNNVCTIDNAILPPGQSVEFRVWTPNGTTLEIKHITFNRVSP